MNNPIEIDAVSYTDGVVHIFGDIADDGVTETVTIEATFGGRLSGLLFDRWNFRRYQSVDETDAASYTSSKGDALQCLFEAINARRYGGLYVVD